jgi:hypothetical protein
MRADVAPDDGKTLESNGGEQLPTASPAETAGTAISQGSVDDAD